MARWGRYFKPDNVLVDREGRVRVVDFGLAEHRDELALRDSSARVSLDSSAGVHHRLAGGSHEEFTSVSGQQNSGRMIGTPAYMAPEQHLGAPADARADQFSFCASLYEALHGERPFAGGTLGELRKNLLADRVRSPPARTSVPPWLRRVLLRGLSSGPERRWPDMSALLTALTRDPGVALRRRLLLAGVVVAVLAALVAGYASRRLQEDQQAVAAADRRAACEAIDPGAAWDAARRARVGEALLATGLPYAADTWDRARARLDAHALAWKDMSVGTCLSAQVDGSLAPAVFERRVACLQRQRAELDALTLTLASADARVLERAVQATVTLPRPEQCAETDARADDESDEPGRRGEVEALRQSLARGAAMATAGRYADALRESGRVVEAARGLGERGLEAEALQRVGQAQELSGDFKAAEVTLRDGFFLAETAGRDVLRAQIATTLAGVVGFRLARVSEGLAWLRHAQAIGDRLAIGAEARASLLSVESGLRRTEGDLDRAGELASEALALLEQLHGPDDVRVARAQLNLGTHLFDRGEYPRAEQRYRRALEIFEQVLGPSHPDLAGPLNNLASAAEKQGRAADAERAYARAIAIREAAFGERHPGVGISLTNLGELHAREGDPARAEVSFRRAAQIFDAALGPEHPNLASALGGLGRALVAQGRLEEARPLHLRAQQILERALGADHVFAAFPQVDLAALELAAGHPAAAIAHASRALELRADGKPEERAEAALTLSRALWESGRDRPRAVALAAQADADFHTAGPGFAREQAAAQAWRRSLAAP